MASAFAAALKRLDGAGVRVSRETLPLFDAMNAVNAKGGISPPEACAIHRDWMGRRPNDIDPNVRARIARGCEVSAADYVDMMRARAQLVRAMDARLVGLDALIMPTTSIVAPTIAEVADEKVFGVAQCRAAAQHRDHQLLRPVRGDAAAAGGAAAQCPSGLWLWCATGRTGGF